MNENSLISENPLDKDGLKTYSIYIVLFVSIVYSAVMILIPWESFQIGGFVDKKEYYSYFIYEKNILTYRNFDGLSDYLKHEALWHYVIDLLIHYFKINIDYIFNFISFFCVFIFSFFLVKNKGYLSFILLTNPLLIDLAFSQFRLALVLSILLTAYLFNKKVVTFFALLICVFIHTATLLFFGIFFIIFLYRLFINKSNRKRKPFVLLLFVGLFVSLAIGPGLEIILSFFGDRRAVVYVGDASSGIKYTLFWIGLLFLCALQDHNFYRNNVNCYAVIILSICMFNLFTGGYTSRLIAASLPMIMYAILGFNQNLRYMSMILYLFYVSLQWIYWLNVPIIR